ncbi:hypothetical protein B0G80_4814 [Paraburkholderia sp. BL6669N2]|nr:hypothetical protein B0G80_4814 [Paraburkholderia sp. BL6669N2]
MSCHLNGGFCGTKVIRARRRTASKRPSVPSHITCVTTAHIKAKPSCSMYFFNGSDH